MRRKESRKKDRKTGKQEIMKERREKRESIIISIING